MLYKRLIINYLHFYCPFSEQVANVQDFSNRSAMNKNFFCCFQVDFSKRGKKISIAIEKKISL